MRECTIAFTNIVGYAEIAATVPVENLAHYMSTYFEGQCRAIVETGGTVVQYIGDKLMAVWDTTNAAESAAKASLLQHVALVQFNVWASSQNFPKANNRIGMSTGTIFIEYGLRKGEVRVLGDHVNLASRLEPLAKDYGATKLMDERTHDHLFSAKWAMRQADKVRVKGKEQPVRLFELIGYISDLSQADSEALALHQSALNDYEASRFGNSMAKFVEVMRLKPDDCLASLYIERCQELLKHPEHGNWDGVMPYFVPDSP